MNARHCAVRMRTVMSDSSSSGSSCSTNAGSSGERIHCFGFSDISSTQQEAASATSGKELRGRETASRLVVHQRLHEGSHKHQKIVRLRVVAESTLERGRKTHSLFDNASNTRAIVRANSVCATEF